MRAPRCELHTGRGSRAGCILHFALCVAVLTASCAQKTLTLPTGRGTALPDAADLHTGISKACAGVRTLTAELSMSGTAGGQRLRGRALVGFEAPDAMRLEGVAPIGPPAFILVAKGGEATLLLPRDERVLRDEKPGAILGALTGVMLAPADLEAILTGCVVPSPKVASGSELGGWVILELEGGATLYLRRDRGTLQLRAARRDNWQIEYPQWQGSFPGAVRLVSTGEPAVDITAQLAQLETNIDIDAAAFTVDVPNDTAPITLEELRQAGPLRGSSASTSRREGADGDGRRTRLARGQTETGRRGRVVAPERRQTAHAQSTPFLLRATVSPCVDPCPPYPPCPSLLSASPRLRGSFQ